MVVAFLSCACSLLTGSREVMQAVELRRKIWARYFRETTPETAVDYVKPGIR